MAESGVTVAGPGIEIRFLSQFSFERISLDVSTGLQEIGILHDWQTLVTALPEMTRSSIDLAMVPGIGELESLQRGDQRLGVFGIEEEMDMVGHQAIVVTAQGRGFREELVK